MWCAFASNSRSQVLRIRSAHGCVFQYTEPDGFRLTDLARRAGLTKPTLVAAVDEASRALSLGRFEYMPAAGVQR